MRSMAWLIVGAVLAGGAWVLTSNVAPESAAIDDAAPFATLEYSPAAPDEVRAIKEFAARYYSTLRKGDYRRAATMYEPGTIVALPMPAEEALKAATDLGGGIPEDVHLEAVRVKGNHAIAEVVIGREGRAPANLVMHDSLGKRLGTWACTLHFKKIGGAWFLTAETMDGDDALSPEAQKKLIEMLNNPD